ncbi:S-layer homology domain-containing protein [Candidatus Gracilibacteria bacterium]|nr:S-layer homology domain-containing protein [Candidatus Gracilibacteria bacterium]MCF7856011.1 S-layer homology domain-containing protein [Candidatus Gracilibacteria bacterium]MCF7896434.1 S-layer homology domain-containing protein [Candidatus Gracilibacteria bacterium]
MKFRALLLFVSVSIFVSTAFAGTIATSGSVLSSASDEKLVRAEVWLNGEFHSHTNLNGEFQILGAAEGDVIRVRKDDYVGTSAIAESSNDIFEFQLAPVWRLESAHQVYEDVPEYAWFEPAVRELYETQTLGTSERGKFFPSENLTRGELAVLGVKVAGFLPEPVEKTNFCDIAAEDDFAPAIEFMFNHGWLSGYPSTDCGKGRVFRPTMPVNRAEAVKMALIAFQDLVDRRVEETVCLPSGFTDVPHDAWFTEFVDQANCLSFVNGYPDGSFRPANPVNRAEIAVILVNALESLFK